LNRPCPLLDWKPSAARLVANLIEWYRSNGRDLPWRRTTDPYAIWVSEIMLQQTQVKTVIPYFERWMHRFPSVESLATAPEDDVLACWQGLGYYRRAKNLRAGAQRVAAEGMPTDYRHWLDLPGIGEYTAAAIASIAQHQRFAVVDGNVERVYARVNASTSTSSRLTREARVWAQGLLNASNAPPGEFNQAMMELGACVCTPRSPLCCACPFNDVCLARAKGCVTEYPIAKHKPDTISLERHGAAYLNGNCVALQRIPDGEWWEGMWTLPWSEDAPSGLRLGQVRQAVTKHRITFHLWLVESQPEATVLFPLTDLPAIPALQRKAITLICKDRAGIQG
jgi:A/G-specific adenine glycosylase